MGCNRAIGVFDSGLGGLTVVKELLKSMPNESIIYFGDTGRVPYGTRSHDTIKKYALEDENFLLKSDVKLIIAACGTVSSVAADTGDILPVPFFEVVSHTAKYAAEITKNGKIGVLGTNATVKSESHKKHILEYLPSAKVTASACPMFVSLVEEGWCADDDVIVLETAKRYLKPIIDAGCDTVILGCTHFPVLKGAIKSILGQNVTLVDAGVTTAKVVDEYLKNNNLENSGESKPLHKFYVSDRPSSFGNIASSLLGREICDSDIIKVDLSKI